MTSARKIKLHVPAPKPRNPLVAAAARRKAGRHQPSKSTERHESKMALRRQLKDL